MLFTANIITMAGIQNSAMWKMFIDFGCYTYIIEIRGRMK